jgi:cell fate (sporulation/competence/biofilm development) regulator YlbF (YheA/YmcA/DUF963 family)
LQEQLKNEKRVSAAAFSLIKLAEDEFKCNLLVLQPENIISMTIKQIEAKLRALESKNEKFVQMQATIEGLTKTGEANNRAVQELREKQKQLQATIDDQRKTEEENNRTVQELREKQKQLQTTIDVLTKILEPLNCTFENVSTCKAEAFKTSKWAEKLLAINLVIF